mmetsp:Transcript_95278/g.253078  ORF Transcript_95278/g.253078 Transcript_95278/m.253078 type:complete len:257 (-) Transcript_95278:11-781(-)
MTTKRPSGKEAAALPARRVGIGAQAVHCPRQVSSISTVSRGPRLWFLPPRAYTMSGSGSSKRKKGATFSAYSAGGSGRRWPAPLLRLSSRISKQSASHAPGSAQRPPRLPRLPPLDQLLQLLGLCGERPSQKGTVPRPISSLSSGLAGDDVRDWGVRGADGWRRPSGGNRRAWRESTDMAVDGCGVSACDSATDVNAVPVEPSTRGNASGLLATGQRELCSTFCACIALRKGGLWLRQVRSALLLTPTTMPRALLR